MAAQQAPDFTLEHVVTGRKISLKDYRGKPVVLTFTGRHSGDQSEQIDATLRARYSPADLPTLGVADLHGVPRLMRGFAKEMVQRGYKKGVTQLTGILQSQGQPIPGDMSEVVIIMPDLDGAVTTAYGVGNVENEAAAVLIDEQGFIKGTARGAGAGQELLSMLQGSGA